MEELIILGQSHSVIINVASNSENPTEVVLSNLAHAPFELDGMIYSSVEAFWQGLKFADEEIRAKIAMMYGIESKKIGNDAPKSETFLYLGEVYQVGSPEHQGLMKRAIRAKLEQNPEILKLLIETGSTEIIHRPMKKDGALYPESTTIPGEIFSGFLMELRNEFQEKSAQVVSAMKERVEVVHNEQ